MNKQKVLFYLIVFLSLAYIGNRLAYLWSIILPIPFDQKINLYLELLTTQFFGPFSFSTDHLTFSFGLGAFGLLFLELKGTTKTNYRQHKEYGSATWSTKKDIEPFLPKKFQNRVLLSQSEALMINEKPKDPKNQRNLNILVIGGSGSGKTRYIVKPNLMQKNSSYVLTDSKGSLIFETGKMFEEAGYDIKVLNLIDFKKSMHYNPFHYIHSESDILKFVNQLIANTGSNKSGGDQFWENTERLLFMAYIGLIFEMGEEEDRNFDMLIQLINNSQVNEEDENAKNAVDLLFDDLEEINPKSFALSQYNKYKVASGKTAKSILISVATRLAPFDIREFKALTNDDELELQTIGDRKTILYIIVSDTDDTFNFLAGILYSQLFNTLTEHADSQPGAKLKVPLQVYLDEFANIGKIPNFEKLIATIRSRGISAMIILQSIAQLDAKYKEQKDTIIGNCDTEIFLGGKEEKTLKSLTAALGKETVDMRMQNQSQGKEKSYSISNSRLGRDLMTIDEIQAMDNDKELVLIRGLRPFLSEKINLEKHPNYALISESYQDQNFFDPSLFLKKWRENQLALAIRQEKEQRPLEEIEVVFQDDQETPNIGTFTLSDVLEEVPYNENNVTYLNGNKDGSAEIA